MNEMIALMRMREARMRAAEDDNAEACLDDAAESHNGDEFVACHDRRSMDSEERHDDLVTIIAGHEEMMIAYADKFLCDDPVWSLMKQQHQALMESI
jgi:hypothetical protein